MLKKSAFILSLTLLSTHAVAGSTFSSCPTRISCSNNACQIFTQYGDESLFSPPWSSHAAQFVHFMGATVSNYSNGYGVITCNYSDDNVNVGASVATIQPYKPISYDPKNPKNWCVKSSDPKQCQFNNY